MKDHTEITPPKHSFLFWLVIPLLIVWFATNYIRASVNKKTQAGVNNVLSANTEIKVYTQSFPEVPENQSGFVTLWFDDAWASQYKTAYPILQKYNMVGAMAVPTKAVETTSYVNWDQIKKLQREGWEITNHSQTHDCNMQNWSKEDIRNELIQSSATLWAHQLSSDIFVSPCGVNSPLLENEVRHQFYAYRTVDPGINDLSDFSPYNLKIKNIDVNTTHEELTSLLDETKQNKGWLIIVFHKIGETSANQEDETYNISAENFENLLNEIQNREMPVVTPSQILENL